eukprot:CAMPEP_0196581748 /NCGR_PEP_ID=MMETSP1081-20130531/35324_1 /TAXON_ID=36882 /ORGANISM="Pyramimonas amylifera, Strain CCMP720" /LENGTH=533 /DNA_ID=CAMNT_0041902089 /DNA_START=189 /DNA_END=1790 /DNA_ORIENTATION=+
MKNDVVKIPSELGVQGDIGRFNRQASIRALEGPGTWQPYEFPKIATPSYWCRWTSCYSCYKPFPNIPIFFNVQMLLVSACCLGVIGLAAATADCSVSGVLSTFAGLATFLIVPHSSIFIWLFGISFERALDYHKMFAYVSVICGFIHLGTCSSSSTGYILIGLMSLLVICSQSPLRRYAFETFYKLHWFLFILTIVFAVLHESASLMCIGALFWLFDVLYRYFFLAMLKYPREAKAYALPANVIKITFPKGEFNYRGGQYLFLCIPTLTSFQWHPFSVSSSPDQDLVSIHIRVLGDWTSKLYELCKPGGADGLLLKVLIEGPYGEPSIDIDGPKYKSFLLISGGIGVTPMQSIANDLLHQYNNGRPMNKIWFVWSVADRDMVDVMFNSPDMRSGGETNMERLSLSGRLPTSFSPDTLSRMSSINLTRGTKDVEKQITGFDPLYSEYYLTRVRKEEDFATANIDPSVQQCLRFGRPKFDDIVTKMHQLCRAHKDPRCAVLVCGPKQLVEAVRRKCVDKSGSGVVFDFHCEIFDF